MQKMLNIFVFNMIATDFCTVKLGDKEQIGVKELFRDYQPFYTIILPLDKELLTIKKMSKLGVEHEILKISKKGDFRKFFDQFWDLTLKRVPKICDPHILSKLVGTKVIIDYFKLLYLGLLS